MRCYLFIFLLLRSLTLLLGQSSVSADIGLAADHCTGPNPNTDCTEVPLGQNELTYLPGVDSLILVTYRFTNHSAHNVTKIKLRDSRRGLIIASTTVLIAPGQTVHTNRRYPPPTVTTGSWEATVTASVEYSTGATAGFSSSYTLTIAEPELEFEYGMARKADACPGADQIELGSCPVDLGLPSLTVGAGDTLVHHYQLFNTGPSPLLHTNITEENGDTLLLLRFDFQPGSGVLLPAETVAPDLPGTYSRWYTARAYDHAGNAVSQTIYYDLIVEEPSFALDFGVVRKADACPGLEASIIATCPVEPGSDTVTVEPGDTLLFHTQATNTGLGAIREIRMIDHTGSLLYEYLGLNSTIITGHALMYPHQQEAPVLPGTYDWSVTVTCTDLGGNQIALTAPYTVVVAAPGNRTAPGPLSPQAPAEVRVADHTHPTEAQLALRELPTPVIFPNPAGDWITLSNVTGEGIVQVFAADGRPLLSTELEAGQRLDVSALSPGTYWLRFRNIVRPFIKR